MAVDIEETRRARALLGVASPRDRSWSAGGFDFEVSNPRTRVLGESRVLTVEVLVRRNGIAVYEDQINMPNPPIGVLNSDGSITENPLLALRHSIRDVVRAVTDDGRFPRLERRPDGTFKGDTLAVRATTADGRIESDASPIWSVVRNGNSLGASSSGNPGTVEASDIGPGTEYQIHQFFLDFDTSTLGAGATITNAVFALYGNGTAETNTDSYDMQIRPYDWGGTLTTADYVDCAPETNWTGLTLMAHFTVASWNETAGTANNFTLDSHAPISKTAVTYVVVGMSALGSTTAPTGVNLVNFRSANQAGTSSDPLLTVTYTPGGTAYTQTLTATVTPAGAISKKVTSAKAGTVTPAATVANKVASTKTGSVTPAAALAQTVAKYLAGAVTPAADVSTRQFTGQTLDGTVTPAATVTHKVAKYLASTVTPVAAVANAVRKTLGGDVSPDGSATNVRTQPLTIEGAVTPAATLVSAVRKTLTATVTPAAVVANAVRKTLGGSVTPAATVAHKVAILLVATVTPSATLGIRRALAIAGTVTPAGVVTTVRRQASVIWALARDILSIFATARDEPTVDATARDIEAIAGEATDRLVIPATAYDLDSITGRARDG